MPRYAVKLLRSQYQPLSSGSDLQVEQFLAPAELISIIYDFECRCHLRLADSGCMHQMLLDRD